MNPSPLPQPASHTCPNCGAAVDGNPTFCPHCGTPLRATSQGGGSGCLTIFAQVVLACVAMIFGLAGACFVVLGGTDMNSSGNNNGSLGFVLGGLFGVFIAGLCIWGIFKLGKR